MRSVLLIQALKQVWGMMILRYKYQDHLPNIENYHSHTKYSLPFNGRWVVANGGVTEVASHSWEIPTQRYAYDFIIMDEDGKSFRGGETDASSFYCYGKDILAPADGVAAEVCAGNPNSKITLNRAAACDARDLRGNYVLIRHSVNEYSLLAHLKPDSILISVGQSVKKGDKLAECGNSGNTTEPHLHFQVQLGKSFYTSPGLPAEFGNITAEDTPNYGVFDDRHLEEEGKRGYPPYIGVGQTVSNVGCGIEE